MRSHRGRAVNQSHVAIIGGGLSGLAAAEALSHHAPEIKLTLIESKRNLGGRAGSYVDPETNGEVDYCQHVAMGCCTNLIDMLTRCGLQQHLRRYRELTFLHPDHPASRFAPARFLPAPLHLIGTIFSQRYLSLRQKREILGGLWKLIRCAPDSLTNVRAAEWLQRAGQRPDTIAEFWDTILVSALGEQTAQVSMSAARKVLIDGFAIAHGACDVLVPSLPLAELFGRRLADVLRSRGVEIVTGQPVRQLSPAGEVIMDGSRLRPNAVICALPWYRIEKLFQHWPDSRHQQLPDLKSISQIPGSSISGLHLWFDRPITDLDHAVMVGTEAQWIFRDPVAGPEKLQDQFYYQVVISASAAAKSTPGEVRLDAILAELRHAFPAACQAQLLHHRWVTDPQSVFSIRPEVEAIRPAGRTAIPWLALAGDWTRTQWPATMEGAVISGRTAAKIVADPLQHAPESDFVCGGLSPGFVARLLIRNH